MEWLTVRLTRNGWRGGAGLLVEMPAPLARPMLQDGRVKPTNAQIRTNRERDGMQRRVPTKSVA